MTPPLFSLGNTTTLPHDADSQTPGRVRHEKLPTIEFVMAPVDELAVNHFSSSPARRYQHHISPALDHVKVPAPLPYSSPPTSEHGGPSLHHHQQQQQMAGELPASDDFASFQQTAPQMTHTPESVSSLPYAPFQSPIATAADEALQETPHGNGMQTVLFWPPSMVAQASLQNEAAPPAPSWDVPSHAMFRAVRNGHENIVRLLIDSRADLSKRDQEGRTIIHYAVECRKLSITQMLLEHLEDGALLNARDASGSTPLHIAMQLGDVGTAAMLLEFGVDTHVANNDGDVALDLAIDAGSLALVQLLAAYRV